MKQIAVTIQGITPYSQSQQFEPEGELAQKRSESHDEYARRTWPAKMHVSDDGHVVIPAMALKQAIDAASKELGKIKGRGNKTWGSLFTGGVMVLEDVETDVAAVDVPCKGFYCDTGGAKGDKSSRRVKRYFPMIPKGWTATGAITVVNEEIPADLIRKALEYAGLCVGIGRFRPSKGGNNGMFIATDFSEESDE